MKKETIISYAQNLEDVILYHVLKNETEIFYIDGGANDSTYLSVTRFLYDIGIAYGINVDPLKACIESYKDRDRDINICAGIGRESGVNGVFYFDNEKSTGASFNRNKYVKEHKVKTVSVPILSLEDICKKHMNGYKAGGFLKLDLEGFEYDALAGMNFKLWRPAILVIEAKPFKYKEKWERIVIKNGYERSFYYGGSRYYTDINRKELKKRFLSIENLIEKYDIFVPYNRLIEQRRMYENSTSWKATKIIRNLSKIKDFRTRKH